MYYIKKISILTKHNQASFIDLSPGVNIIYGPSNTGKSLIVDCIDFLFGGDAERLYKKELGITGVVLSLDVDGKEASLTRKLYNGDKHSNDIIVSAPESSLSGTYKVGKGSKKTPPINKYWLHLMGIDEEDVKIVSQQDFTPNRLTARTFLHTFLINETRMVGENSILKNIVNKYTNNIPTSTITSLIYLATGENFIEQGMTLSKEKNEIAIKRNTAQRMVDLSISALKYQVVATIPRNKDYSVVQLKSLIEQLLMDIGGAEESLEKELANSQKYTDELLGIDEKISRSLILKNRYDSLRTQYESDLKRLTFIAEADIHSKELPKVERCPFCNGELAKDKEQSCVEAAIAEAEKIGQQISDLRFADEELQKEIDSLKLRREDLCKRRAETQSYIRGELKPKIAGLKDKLADYTAALEFAKTEELVGTFNKVLNDQLDVINEEDETEDSATFNVRAKAREYLSKYFEKYSADVLTKSHYYNFTGVRFDEDKCDIVVNGSDKLSQGKGFRAFLNTTMAIAVQETLNEYGLHQPHLLVLDSPILSLSENDVILEKEAADGMRRGIFKYLLSHTDNRQTIIIENTIPSDLDYSTAKVIHFTKEKGDSMYGLISGVTD